MLCENSVYCMCAHIWLPKLEELQGHKAALTKVAFSQKWAEYPMCHLGLQGKEMLSDVCRFSAARKTVNLSSTASFLAWVKKKSRNGIERLSLAQQLIVMLDQKSSGGRECTQVWYILHRAHGVGPGGLAERDLRRNKLHFAPGTMCSSGLLLISCWVSPHFSSKVQGHSEGFLHIAWGWTRGEVSCFLSTALLGEPCPGCCRKGIPSEAGGKELGAGARTQLYLRWWGCPRLAGMQISSASQWKVFPKRHIKNLAVGSATANSLVITLMQQVPIIDIFW